eukprot:8833223-Pyramimonas_sp.AAC.1
MCSRMTVAKSLSSTPSTTLAEARDLSSYLQASSAPSRGLRFADGSGTGGSGALNFSKGSVKSEIMLSVAARAISRPQSDT